MKTKNWHEKGARLMKNRKVRKRRQHEKGNKKAQVLQEEDQKKGFSRYQLKEKQKNLQKKKQGTKIPQRKSISLGYKKGGQITRTHSNQIQRHRIRVSKRN